MKSIRPRMAVSISVVSPFFDGQSLTHPLPQTKEEVTACLDEMVRRIYDRAEKMSDFASLKR